jgi:hypothetical protein
VILRQSMIASYGRCAQQYWLRLVDEQAGESGAVLSATAFGTVIHHALHVLEVARLGPGSNETAVELAVETFEHYWDPQYISALTDRPVDVWLPRQTWGGLRIRGRKNIREYAEFLERDDGLLLALEHHFEGPISLPGVGMHMLQGQIDRLSLRKHLATGKPFLAVEDTKSGKKPTYLRYAMQWTIYSWATTQPWFWEQWPEKALKVLLEGCYRHGLALYEDQSQLPLIPRKGYWHSVREAGFNRHDCGWRTELDFVRMKLTLAEFVKANEKGVFPLNVSGDTCVYCEFSRNGRCGGVALAEVDEEKFPVLFMEKVKV